MPKKNYMLITDGTETIESLATVDVLAYAGVPVTMVSTGDNIEVKLTGNITVKADTLMKDCDFADMDWLLVPGGVEGAKSLYENKAVSDLILRHYNAGGNIASLCHAPAVVLAPLGVLKGKKATCYPGFGDRIDANGGTYVRSKVVVEPHLITSEAPGTTCDWAIEIIRAMQGDEAAKTWKEGLLIGTE